MQLLSVKGLNSETTFELRERFERYQVESNYSNCRRENFTIVYQNHKYWV